MYTKEMSFYSILGSYFLVLPVIEVHDCLYGTASSSGDVSLQTQEAAVWPHTRGTFFHPCEPHREDMTLLVTFRAREINIKDSL